MKRLLLTLSSLAIAVLLPACLQSETTVHLNKDGSGTIVEQTTFGQQVAAMLEQMSALGGDAAAGKDPLAEIFSEEKAKEKAKTLGDGVTFEKSEPVMAGANRGARVTYRFTDINKLKIAPGEGMSDLSPMAGQMPATAKPDPIAFTYADGKLTIALPEPKKPEAGPNTAAIPEMAENPQMEGMMKQMLGDMKISFKVVIEPGIAETDATHRDGKTITLTEMEMGKILEKPEAFKKLQKVDQNDPTAAIEALKGMEGVKMETKKVVTVKVG